ncbi:MAG: hypothetical protein K8S55_11415 [Phycisphaerae bacterium]|nr:hypothetical protein [Phycisphaerae bacterium]
MKAKTVYIVILLLCAITLQTKALPTQATSAPASLGTSLTSTFSSKSRVKTQKTPKKKSKKSEPYITPTASEIEYAKKKSDEWAEKMKKINPKVHLIETKHFRIYSTYPKSHDGHFKSICAKLYRKMCRQFGISPKKNIWIGKLSIYIFATRKGYETFYVDVIEKSEERSQKSGGLSGCVGAFQYVLIAPLKNSVKSKSQARSWFLEVLVHESSHAFIARYINNNRIPNWIDEGIAEIMAATFVPRGSAARKFVSAAKKARKNGSNIDGIFDCRNIPLDSFHYGIAQSMVRFLIRLDQKKFINLIHTLKKGKNEHEALQEAYGMTRQEMVKKWYRYISARRRR